MIHLHARWAHINEHALLLLPKKFCGLHKTRTEPLLIACADAIVLTPRQGMEGAKVDQILTRGLQQAIPAISGVSFAVLLTSHLRSQIPCHRAHSIIV